MTDTGQPGSSGPDTGRPGRRSPAGQPGGPAGGPPVRTVAALVVVATLVLGAAAVLASRGDGDGPGSGGAGDGDGWHGALLPEPQPRPDFTLTDTAGRPYDFAAETQGRLTVLFFGYTSCPDVCPVQMATLSAALDQPGMPDPTVVFVTTDPERDTPERLRDWLDTFDPAYIGLRGTPEEIHAAERAANIAASTVPSDASGDDYEVGHAAQMIAYTPDDLSHVVYPSGVQRQDWQADLPRLMDTWGRPEAATR
ncbi:MAG: SCO family protein [Acidimicrobiia bacterium]